MAREIQTNQTLEHDTPARERLSQEDEQTGGRAAVSNHIENRAKLCGLSKVACGVTINGIEEAGDAVEKAAGARMQWHIVEGRNGEDNAGVAWRISSQPRMCGRQTV